VVSKHRDQKAITRIKKMPCRVAGIFLNAILAPVHNNFILIFTKNEPGMKQFLMILVLATATAAQAQMPKIKKAEIKTPGTYCEACKATIEKIAPQYLDGLVKINVLFKQKKTLVQWYPDRTNLEEIKTAIANAGFDADDVTANPDSYKKLEDCCKKPEDRVVKPAPTKPKS